LFAYKLVVFLGAFLLFQIELIIAKSLLPVYGGSFHVWTTCMIFFLGMIFLGYLYSCIVLKKIEVRKYAFIHVILLVLVIFTFPIPVSHHAGDGYQILNIMKILFIAIGVPFFLLSTTSTIVQGWFSFTESSQDQGAEPYFLYSYSNWGSFTALFSYPVIFEPFFEIKQQLSIIYCLYVIYIIAYFFCFPKKENLKTDTIIKKHREKPVYSFPRLYWIMLSGSACALMIAVTNVITSEIGTVPLLWVVPLSIYLLTIILNFKSHPFIPARGFTRTCWFILGFLGIFFVLSQIFIIPLMYLLLFIACMKCHRKLFLARPESTDYMPDYYVYISLGGWLGTVIIYILVPFVARYYVSSFFDFVFALIFVICSLMVPYFNRFVNIFNHLTIKGKIVVFVLMVFGIIGVFNLHNTGKNTVYAIRNFYGLRRVVEKDGVRFFIHGKTLHGKQFTDTEKQSIPLAYFNHISPVSSIFNVGTDYPNVGIVGLGIGSLVTYSKKGQSWDFYEIDPDVIDIAKEKFTYLSMYDSRTRIITGDGRLMLKKSADHYYDLLVLDAFSSDSVPTHLLTIEAVSLYLEKLSLEGLLVYNISNNYIELKVVLASMARALNLHWASKKEDFNDHDGRKISTEWFAMSRNRTLIHKLVEKKGWEQNKGIPVIKTWTDGYVNILAPIYYRLVSRKKAIEKAEL